MPNRLRQIRRDRLLSAAELGALIGVSHACIARIETGARGGSWRTRRKLALALGVPESELFKTDAA